MRTERGALGCMSYLTSRVVSSGQKKVTWRDCCNVLPDFMIGEHLLVSDEASLALVMVVFIHSFNPVHIPLGHGERQGEASQAFPRIPSACHPTIPHSHPFMARTQLIHTILTTPRPFPCGRSSQTTRLTPRQALRLERSGSGRHIRVPCNGQPPAPPP